MISKVKISCLHGVFWQHQVFLIQNNVCQLTKFLVAGTGTVHVAQFFLTQDDVIVVNGNKGNSAWLIPLEDNIVGQGGPRETRN